MPGGTEGFSGASLREAREARGLTAVTLAHLTGVTGAAISQFEHGTKRPRPEVVERLAVALNLPIGFFIGRDDLGPESDQSPVFFRSLSAATKTERLRERRRLKWRSTVSDYLRRYVEFPSIGIPSLDNGRDPLSLSTEDIERIATDLRDEWSLGDEPISDMVALLEAHGVVVVRSELGVNTLDAYSEWISGTPYVVLGMDKESAVRSRYDAAHELCHLILHRHVEESALNTTATWKELEAQAHAFAGAFLLPAQAFAMELIIPTLDSMLALKLRWRVSVGAMIQRARELGLISPEQHQRLWMSYRRRWGHREPFDNDLPAEEPRTLRASFDLMSTANLVSFGELRNALRYSPTDIEQLAGLPPGYLDVLRRSGVRPGDEDAAREPRLLFFPGNGHPSP